jgi:hypothetical protein
MCEVELKYEMLAMIADAAKGHGVDILCSINQTTAVPGIMAKFDST